MIRHLRRVLLGVALAQALIASSAQAQEAPDRERMMAHVRHLADEIGARPANSAAAGRAAAYITEQLGALGLSVNAQEVGEVATGEIWVAGRRVAPAQQFFVSDRNLIAGIPAAEPTDDLPVLLLAHYDSVATTPGAIDNAVGVAILLELARVLVANPPPRPIVLGFPAAEETRLAGAHRMAANLDQPIGLVVAIDLIGSEGELTLNGLSDLLGHDWLVWLGAVAHRAGVAVAAPWTHRIISRWWPQIERSDHGAFTERGIPAFHIYSRDPNRLELTYHSRFDTADHVSVASVGDAADFLLALVRTPGPLPATGGSAGMWLSSGWVLSSGLVVGLDLLLALIGLIGVARLTRQRGRGDGSGLAIVLVALAYVAAFGVVWLILAIEARTMGHAGPWVHHPARHELLAVVLAIAVGILLMRLATWRGPPRGRGRYLAAAILLEVAVGVVLIGTGATELAWMPLWTAAGFGVLPWIRSARWAVPVLLVAQLPLVGPLSPGFLREGVFHGFFPATMPLALYLGVLLLPTALAGLYLGKRWKLWPRRSGPGRFVLIGAVVLAMAAVVGLLVSRPPCSGANYREHGLACELRD